MSKTNVRRPQKKTTIKKRTDWDSTVGDLSQHRLSDDEAVRRKQAYQSKNLTLIQEEKQRKLLAKAVSDARKTNANQLGILREILFNERDVDELMQRSNQILQSGRSDKFVPKSSILRTGKNHFTSLTNDRSRKTSASSTTRPSSTRNLNSPGGADWNQSEDDRASVSSDDPPGVDDDELENEPVRLNRPTKKNDGYSHEPTSQIQFLSEREHSSNRQSQSRPSVVNQGTRSTNNVSFLSDVSKAATKSNAFESTAPVSSTHLKMLLDRLSTELNELETITGYKSEKTDSSSNTCSTALVTALLNLTGHVKQSVLVSKGQNNTDTNTLKDQLAVVVKAQLDFQQKIENQISMLQTMMQTVCQLVNNEIISNRRPANHTSNGTGRIRRDSADFQSAEPRTAWPTQQSSIGRQTVGTKKLVNEDTQPSSSRMTSATPIEMSIPRHSLYGESQEASKKVSRPSSALSNNENNMFDFIKSIGGRRTSEFDSRVTTISPIEIPTSYDAFESGLPKSNSMTSMLRSGMSMSSHATSTNPTPAPAQATNETILEKILQERLVLVQQIAELNKQHEMTQEELAHLEANALKQRSN